MRLLRNSATSGRPDVSIDVSPRENGKSLVRVGGELDLSTVPQLRSCLADLVNAGESNLILDLRDVTFCDSTALGVFVGTHRRLASAGGHVEFRDAPSAVRTLLVVSGLDQILDLT